MDFLRTLVARLTALLRRQLDADLDEELRAHLEPQFDLSSLSEA